MRSRILFISGHHEDARNLTRMLQNLPLVLDHVGDLEQARRQLRQNEYEIILTEAHFADGSWMDVLRLARDCPEELQVIVTDPQADARLWSIALNMGAYDLLTQPFYQPEVRRILYNACCRRPYEEAPLAAAS